MISPDTSSKGALGTVSSRPPPSGARPVSNQPVEFSDGFIQTGFSCFSRPVPVPNVIPLILILLLLPVSAEAVTVISGPTVITEPGTYILDQDILASGAGTGLEVRASNVVIEGSGHRLQGVRTGNAQGIRVQGVRGVTIRDLFLERWDTGLFAANAPGLVVERVGASDNSGTGVLVSGDGTLVSLRDVSAFRNRDGIMLATCSGVHLEGVTASLNLEHGITLHESSGCTIAGSTVVSNGRAGLSFAGGGSNTIWNNWFSNTVNVMNDGRAPPGRWAVDPPQIGPNVVGGPSIGGNYWSSPASTGFSDTTPDKDDDGFCDVAWIDPDSTIQDPYPLHLPAAPRVIGGPNKVTITAPGTYRLGADLVSDLPVAIEVLADDVVIDGQGHLLEGPGLGGMQGACGILVNGARQVTLSNIRVRDWVYGVFYDQAPDGRIERLSISNASFSGLVVSTGSDRCEVTGSILSGNTCGLYLASVSGCRIWNNRFASADDVVFGGICYPNEWNITRRPGDNIVGGPNLGGNWWEGVSAMLPDEDHDGIGDQSVPLAYGNVDSAPLVRHVPGAPPRPAFDWDPRTGPAPLRVQFQDQSENLGPLEACTWTWDFGDGTIGSGRKPLHVFVANGTYRVNLTVTNRFGEASRTDVVTAGAGTPLAAALDSALVFETDGANGWFGCKDPTALGSSSARSGSVGANGVSALQTRVTGPFRLSFRWRCSPGPGERLVFLVDGLPEQTLDRETGWTSATRVVPSGTHVLRWEYHAGTTGTSGSGAGYLDAVRPDAGPRAAFNGSPQVGTAPLTVIFTDRSTGGPTDWQWEFGDGESAGGQSIVAHTYHEPGTYPVALTVSNPDGYDTARAAAYITVLPPLAASFTAVPPEGRSPLAVRFTDTSTGDPTHWRWEFGDGQVVEGPYPAVTHVYSQPGEYPVRLTVSKPDAMPAIATRTVRSLSASPSTVDFTADTAAGYAPFAVRFTDASTNSPTSWHWDFGDGTTSNEKSPVHTYVDNGSYTVSLEAMNGDGGDRITKDHLVRVAMPPRVVLVPSPLSVADRGQRPVRVFLDSVPFGLSGFRVTLTIQDGSRANISGSINFPPGLSPIDPATDPGRNATITFKAADTPHVIEAGATDVLLATLTVLGERVGSTELTATVDVVTDDDGRSLTLEPVTIPLEVIPGPVRLEPEGYTPRDLDSNGLYEDLNGNGRLDFQDVVIFFDHMTEIRTHPEWTAYFDFNMNDRIDFVHVTALFHLL